MINKKGQNYCCENCNFYTDNKTKYNRHLKTKKHLLKEDKEKNQIICVCGKSYKSQRGLNYHKNKCQLIKDLKFEDDVTKDEIIKMQNDKLKMMDKELEMMDKEYNKLQGSYINSLENTLKNREQQGTKLLELAKKPNIINNQMTINVYLNEKCKGAMSLTDFVDKIKISLQDLSFTNKNGLIEGVSNIFVKELEDMEPTERPIHCSNKKDMQFYIKDSDKWEQDKQHIKLDKSIENVMNKQLKQIKIWEKEHPNFMDDDKLVKKWHKMISNTIVDDKKKDFSDIKKKIVSSVEIKNDLIID
jgi:hypothetical protein